MDIEQAMTRVGALDFTMLKQKLTIAGGWSANTVEEGERLYRRYLALNLVYPDRKLGPTPLIDDFWHAHILDTEAYTADCQSLFGRYLHHYPYGGLTNDPLDQTIAESVKEETRKLFRKHFHIDL